MGYSSKIERSITMESQRDSSPVLEVAHKAELLYEAAGKIAARNLVLSCLDFDSVLAGVQSGDELTRRKSLSLLEFWDAGRAAAELVRVLRFDPCPIVRHEAAYFLATLKRAETVAPLIEALLNDGNELVRHEAAEALGDMGATTAISALEQVVLKDASEVVVRTARISIQQLSFIRQRLPPA